MEPAGLFRHNHTVGRFCLDTCVLIGLGGSDRFVAEELPALGELIELQRQGRVLLSKTDTADVERTGGPIGPGEEARRLLETVGMIETLGPFIAGHSRVDHSVFASPDDLQRIDEVLAIVHPSARRDDPKYKNDVRDAMHIATSIRYGYSGFVTTDKKLWKAAANIRSRWGLEVFRPADAVTWVRGKVVRIELSAARRAQWEWELAEGSAHRRLGGALD